MLSNCRLWLILLFIFPLRVFCQSNYYEPEPKVFDGGAILGVNFSQVDGDTYFGYHKVGVQVGGVVYVHFTKVFGASVELLYSQKGSRGESVKESPAIGTYVSKYFMNLNYAEIPLTFHAVIRTIDVEAGISYGLLVSSKEWVQTDQPVVIDPDKNRFNTSDIDYVFGIGRRVYKKLFANVRYQYSVTSMRPPERIPVGFGFNNNGQFNNLFNFRLMYYF